MEYPGFNHVLARCIFFIPDNYKKKRKKGERENKIAKGMRELISIVGLQSRTSSWVTSELTDKSQLPVYTNVGKENQQECNRGETTNARNALLR